MRETFRNLTSVGKKWESPDIGDEYKNQGRKLSFYRSHMIGGENFSLIPSLCLNKTTLCGVQPWEYIVCGKVFMQQSSHNRHIRCHNGHKSYEYLTYEEKLYKCKVCGKAFVIQLHFKYMKEFTLDRNPIIVNNVEKPIDIMKLFFFFL
ncbi:PREDICTED: zinc finger protein 564-like [Miniopterus natalensis]|uniref:zinc finger protein 564-like n=1 Tax=Miniopterus natalensis TaxID=291302 RepID=UPI0007A70053|nr:PREDICTED: zinc finger protein 564-like [Miniopterus natalensis]